MSKHPRLFHKTSKGGINIWDIWTEGDNICTRWGQKDGKQQEASKKAKPKNTGKKNATTAEEQAVLEAKAMWTKKLDKKYYKTEKEATNELVFLPMLADSFEKRKKFLTPAHYPVSLQPKLDGLRCLAFWDGTPGDPESYAVKLMSRGGKEYILPHIASSLENLLELDEVLDGELYIHGVMLQELNRLVRGSHKYPDHVNVEYHVYDMVTRDKADMPCIKRMTNLAKFHKQHDNTVIREVESHRVYNEAEVLKAQILLVSEGYEGAIVRLDGGEYKFGYRSKELLKVKSFQDAEFEIVDFTSGIGKFKDCIIYTCHTKEGLPFNVVPKGTYEQRKEWLEEGGSHVGRMLKVQFAAWTEDKKPQFPVGICIRLEEDMDG